MYGHMLQLQFPSPPGTPMKVFSGAAFLHLVDDVRFGRDEDRLGR